LACVGLDNVAAAAPSRRTEEGADRIPAEAARCLQIPQWVV
jgi:hypothetical protein